MAAPSAKRTSSANANGVEPSPPPSHTRADSQSTRPLPAKRPRLKLKVRAKQADEFIGDTIAVARPRREANPRSRYSQDTVMKNSGPTQMKPPPKQRSPAPSSGLSSLSSAPPSPREESPFQDPTPPASARDEYGDFMSYYIMGGDDEPNDNEANAKDPMAKPKSRQKARSKSKSETPKTQKQPAPPVPQPQPVKKPRQQQSSPRIQQPGLPPLPAQQQPPPQHAQIFPPQAPRPQTQHAPPPYSAPGATGLHGLPPPGHHPGHPGHHGPPHPPHMQRGPHRQIPLPQPIIQFKDVETDPQPTAPDTVAIMVRKLEDLSAALTNFGGVPGIPSTPPPEKSEKQEKPKAPVKKALRESSNPLDGFLSLFGVDDDDDDESSEDNDPFDDVPANAGVPDGALRYGIQFIQNALRSWAQQRTSQLVAHQWNVQQAEHFQKTMQAQKRGPGRPRQYDTDQPVQPIIQMNLSDTPEGMAIKAFQSVLDSGCLQVNNVLPPDLSRALRHLYIQIDHLINQGSKTEGTWQCMSYGAQIKAHKIRVEQWREAQAKHQEAMAHEHQLAQQQVNRQMGLPPNQPAPLTADQIQHQHAVDLERKRSLQHAAQQPYNATQHLNPLQLGSSAPGNAHHVGAPQDSAIPDPVPAPQTISTSAVKGPNSRPGSAGGVPSGLPRQVSGASQAVSIPNKGGVVGVPPNKINVKVPGVASPSGQPQAGLGLSNPAAAKVPAAQASSSTPTQAGHAGCPIEIDGNGDTAMRDAPPIPSCSAPAAKVSSRLTSRPASVPASSSSDTSPDTIRVTSRHASGVISATTSPSLNASNTIPPIQIVVVDS